MKLPKAKVEPYNISYDRLLLAAKKDDNYDLAINGLTLLHYAAALGDMQKLNFLLTKQVNINNKGIEGGKTPLDYAIKYEHFELATVLIKQGARITTVDLGMIDSAGSVEFYLKSLKELNNQYIISNHVKNNILHHVVENKPELLAHLLVSPEMNQLKEAKNIFGLTPLDSALQKKDIDSVKLLADVNRQEALELIVQFHQEHPIIFQNTLIEKLETYLKLHQRDSGYLNETGLCNGLVMLRHLDKSFYKYLALITNWDGKKQSLSNEVDKHYDNLGQLIEYWLSNLIWFFAGNKTSKEFNVDQTDREKQLSIFEKKLFIHTV